MKHAYSITKEYYPHKSTIYKKTVYELNSLLNTNNLTSSGKFDLEKIKDLRVIDNGFLTEIKNRYNLQWQEISKLIDVPLRTIIVWKAYKKSIPIQSIFSLCNRLSIDKKVIYDLIEGCEFTLGTHRGGNRIILSLDPSNFFLSAYAIPQKHSKVYIVKNTPEKVKKYVLNNFSIDENYYKKKNLIVINCSILHVFLDTFYYFEKSCLLDFFSK